VFFTVTNYGQQKDKVYDSIVSILLKEQTTKFKRLDKSLRRFKRDTVYMQDFLGRCEDIEYAYGQIYANNMLGRAFRNKSLYEKAVKAHNQALQVAENLKDTLSQTYSLNMLGVVYRRQDAVKIALDYHFKALELANALANKDREILKNISIAENSIGNIFNLLEKYDLALIHHNNALLIEEQVANRLGMAINYQNMGSIYENQGNLDKALAYYNKSLTLNEAINSNVGRIICYNSIGSIYLKQKKSRKAIALMIPTIDLAETVGDNFYKAMANINLGRAYTDIKEYKRAEQYLKKGLTLSLDNNYSSASSEAYFYLSALEENKGDYKKALAYTKKYGEYENKILNSKNQQYVNDLIIKVKSKEKNKQIKSLDEENQEVKHKLDKTKRQIYFGVALLILLSILGSIFYAQNKLNNHRKYVELKQNLMRTQMNPHFIFNALNSIKLYIINNEKEQAVYYLNKFSKLIRIILNSSRQKEITLKEEVKNSELYVQIENIRFENNVNFTVDIPNDIELEQIKIPPLILQPFLENAIWHGLSLKQGDKNLTIELIDDKVNACVNIHIIDNGVGREKALAIKKKRIHNKKSLGIQLTKDRLKAFMKEFNKDYSIEIVDLYDKNKEAIGTQVIIKIPYN
jgi:tetratricopeptide (TPR) repeat protein